MDDSPRYGRFRSLLRKAREKAGLSQTALAAKLGKAQTFVSKSELGERRIDFLETLDFCRGCDEPIDEFIHALNRKSSGDCVTDRKKRRSPRKMDDEGRLTGS